MLTTILVFLLGLAIGSFINAVVFRLRRKQSFLRGRSQCPHCRKELKAVDLIPLLSFVLLRGRCRYCRRKISGQYPAVELACGLLLALLFSYFGWSASFIIYALYTFWLAVIFVYDLKHYLILDKVVYSGLALALAGSFFLPGMPWLHALLGSAAAGGFFWLLYLVTKGKGIGGGDVKMGFLIGLMLGWPNILVGLFVAFITGAIVGAVLMLLRRKKMKDRLPFGTFLAAGTVFAFFFASAVISWYWGLFGLW